MPEPVGDLARFADDLLVRAGARPTLAGFDFPLGLPVGYGRRTGLVDFRSALPRFGRGDWADFYRVAADRAEIGLARPFYPASPGGRLRRHLLDGHGVVTVDALTRRCEAGGAGRKAAGCLFWTMGANQVGKAMGIGWRELIVPVLARGARLWPFDGDLVALSDRGLTLAETYPADVYARLGAAFGPRQSKTRAADRAAKAPALLAWTAGVGVDLTPALDAAIRDGFGAADRGGDSFDAVVGLFGMMAVVDGLWAAGAPDTDEIRTWEGWILGRTPRGSPKIASAVTADQAQDPLS